MTVGGWNFSLYSDSGIIEVNEGHPSREYHTQETKHASLAINPMMTASIRQLESGSKAHRAFMVIDVDDPKGG